MGGRRWRRKGIGNGVLIRRMIGGVGDGGGAGHDWGREQRGESYDYGMEMRGGMDERDRGGEGEYRDGNGGYEEREEKRYRMDERYYGGDRQYYDGNDRGARR